MSKVFLDTNILVYSLDQSDPGKKSRCRELLKDLVRERNGVISTQVLHEKNLNRCPKLIQAGISNSNYSFA
jgi:predicted nucleic acid-binding protein